MPQSIYDNGGMIGVTLDFADTDTYTSSGGYDNSIATTSGGVPTFRWSLDGSINEAGGHTTTETGTASFTTGLINGLSSQSADFDGSYNIDIANSASINSANTGGTYFFSKRSMSFWFNADSTTGYKAIWEQGGGVNWFVIYLEGGLLYANIGESSVTGGHATASVSSGQTYHCLVTVDLTLGSNQIKIYLNGSLAGQASSTVGSDLLDHSGDVNIGLSNSRNHLSQNGIFTNYDGRIQDFCYWFEEALTLSDAQSIYAAGIATAGNQKNSGIWSLSSVSESIEPFRDTTTPTSLSYINSYTENLSQLSYSFSTSSFGPGLVTVSVHTENFSGLVDAIPPISVSIGGQPAMLAVEANSDTPSGAGATSSSIWYADLASSSSGVDIAFGTAPVRVAIGINVITNYTSIFPEFTGASADDTFPQSRQITTTSLQSYSTIIAAYTSGNVYTHTWSLPERYDTLFGSTGTGPTGASSVVTSSQPVEWTVTCSGSSVPTQTTSMAVAAWR